MSIMEQLKEETLKIKQMIDESDIDDCVILTISKDGYRDVNIFRQDFIEGETMYSNSDEWEYSKRPRETKAPERDCENCIHYKEVPDMGFRSCEKWDCEFEKVGDADVDE